MTPDEEKPKAPRMTIVLTPELVRDIAEIADEEATPPSVLVRRWIVERIKQHRRGSGER